MHFKFIILLIISFLFNQSLFNRGLGNQQLFGDARSYAMGLTHSVNAYNSSLIRFNPSLIGLATKNHRITFDFQSNYSLINERRSFITTDFFDGFLTYGDYISNDQINNNFQLGMMGNLKNKISFGLALLPLASFDYNYTEEVRRGQSVTGGDIGYKDPLEGYHVFKTEGQLNTLSLGLSFNMHNFYIGIGYHKILDSKITDDIHIDTLTTDIQNLASIQDYYSEKSFKNLGDYYSLGASFKTNELLLSFVLEPDLLIKEDFCTCSPVSSSSSTIFINGVISYFDDDNTIFNPIGIYHYKPQKFILGLSYNPISNRSLVVSTEFESNRAHTVDNIGVSASSILKDYNIYKLGFEYILPSNIPIRAGLIHHTSGISLIPNKSILTFGTGSNFKNILYDIGVSYTLFDYYYSDLFPVESTITHPTNPDKITESNLNFIFTFRYLF